MSSAPVRKLYFGSSQERKLVPFSYPPNRLGNQSSRESAPHVGPGSYDNERFGTIMYDIEKTPMSKKGYGLSARTAARFPSSNKNVAPSPQQYQPDQSLSNTISPGKTPFNSSAERSQRTFNNTEEGPGPGSYSACNALTNKKVSWPMRFGSPDWTRLPQLDKRSLRVQLHSEKEFLKQRSRLAYLSLYY